MRPAPYIGLRGTAVTLSGFGVDSVRFRRLGCSDSKGTSPARKFLAGDWPGSGSLVTTDSFSPQYVA